MLFAVQTETPYYPTNMASASLYAHSKIVRPAAHNARPEALNLTESPEHCVSFERKVPARQRLHAVDPTCWDLEAWPWTQGTVFRISSPEYLKSIMQGYSMLWVQGYMRADAEAPGCNCRRLSRSPHLRRGEAVAAAIWDLEVSIRSGLSGPTSFSSGWSASRKRCMAQNSRHQLTDGLQHIHNTQIHTLSRSGLLA